MAATSVKRIGYGQVEPNHLSGIVTGQIYAQLPAKTTSTAISQLEQGQFVKYDYATGEVNFTGDGEFMLVYNEEKLYDERHQMHKDFVYKPGDFADAKMYPRLIKTNIGDIFTTNMIADASVKLKDVLSPRAADGILSTSGDGSMKWQVVKVYTMPDHQPGVKLMRIE